MELQNSQNNALAKLPMLKLGEYEMWEIRIKQYFQIQDYTLWEVIENGNSWVPISVTTSETGTSTATKMTVPRFFRNSFPFVYQHLLLQSFQETLSFHFHALNP
ncbi:hypothetical protein Tco_1473525 [Tanacetum coccineum]